MTSVQTTLQTAFLLVCQVQFPLDIYDDDWELCSDFFKALIDDSSRWPQLTTIVFKSLPDELFDSLRDFVLARSSEERRFTIRIVHHPVTRYSAALHYSNAVSGEHMTWLRQHVNMEMVPCGHN
jgi:hypothetical protein